MSEGIRSISRRQQPQMATQNLSYEPPLRKSLFLQARKREYPLHPRPFHVLLRQSHLNQPRRRKMSPNRPPRCNRLPRNPQPSPHPKLPCLLQLLGRVHRPAVEMLPPSQPKLTQFHHRGPELLPSQVVVHHPPLDLGTPVSIVGLVIAGTRTGARKIGLRGRAAVLPAETFVAPRMTVLVIATIG